MTTPITTQHYSQITSEINDLLSNNQNASISVFTNQDGSSVALDSNGNSILNQRIASISYTSSYTDVNTSQVVNGFLTITFSSGNTFKSIDNVDQYWYTIQGTSIILKSLE